MKVAAFYVFSVLSLSECSKILGVFPLNVQSHYRGGLAMMKILASRGHEVTFLSPFRLKDPPKGWTDVVLTPPKDFELQVSDLKVHPYLQAYVMSVVGGVLMNETLSHPVFKDFIRSKQQFDVIIIEQFYNDGLKYLGSYFNAPVILYSAQDANFWTNPTVGNPAPPSCVADMLMPYTNEMTFFQRMDNAVMNMVNQLLHRYVLWPSLDRIIKEHFPDAPDISNYFGNVSLVLLNGDTSVYEALPKVPNMVDIGGFHLSSVKPLPPDLKKVLDEAQHGVIYFSMGSNVRSVDLTKEKVDLFIRVFGSLKQTVLWKLDDENLSGMPDNVIIRNWMPQNDILAHKNVKLFITHGGIFSTFEAVNHGVPLLAFPVFGDQQLNANRAMSFGYARMLSLNDVTEDILKAELNELLSNRKYYENVKKRSRILKDKPMSPQEKLIFWVEYVIRHKEVDHLKVATLKLNLFQYLLLDIIAVVFVTVSLGLFIFKYAITYLLKIKGESKTKSKKQ